MEFIDSKKRIHLSRNLIICIQFDTVNRTIRIGCQLKTWKSTGSSIPYIYNTIDIRSK